MTIKDLCAGYNDRIIIGNANAGINKGEIISLTGPNGSGKSTLLKTISGELSPISGTVYIGRDDIKEISLKELSKKLSIVNTERVRPALMTAMEVVLLGRLPYSNGFGILNENDRAAARAACELMKITSFSEKPFENLSDGQKQRTLIARAICQEPDYLIMDEPTSYLDIRYRLELMDVIRQLASRGITVIMSLHEIELALDVSDRLLLVYDNGEVRFIKPEEAIREEVLKKLYDLSDEMYDKIKVQFEKPKSSWRYSSFFVNRDCEYFPCHELSEDRFNCLFCYCPLYWMPDCGGTCTITEKGAKNCRSCILPHDRDNYSMVIKRLKGQMYGTDHDK